MMNSLLQLPIGHTATCSRILGGDGLQASATAERCIFSLNKFGNTPTLAQAPGLDEPEHHNFASCASGINPGIFDDKFFFNTLFPHSRYTPAPRCMTLQSIRPK